MADVLIIDDDKAICDMLTGMIRDMGHNVDSAGLKVEARKKVSAGSYDVVFLDARLPDGCGLDILPDIRQTTSSPEVIVMTGYGDPDSAEIAISNGAWDYLQKPLSPKQIILPLSRVLKHRDERDKSSTQSLALEKIGILGSSKGIRGCYEMLGRAARSDANVLLTGETGTGKDLFSRAIHENSNRSSGRFVIVDCASLPETLVESVIFGHVKGSFTGADTEQEGLIKQADNGTLFLDEMGELPLNIQKTFLRVLQEHRFRPVGGKKEITSNFRLICATNRNLESMVASGLFREDLFYRLKSIVIELPSLKSRKKDINVITLHHIKKICERNRVETKECSPEFLLALERYNWPGNVRQLVNTLENACSTCGDEQTLHAVHLPVQVRINSARESIKQVQSAIAEPSKNKTFSRTLPSFRKLIDETENQYLRDLIAHSNGDIKMCCTISGLSRSRMYALLKKHCICRTYS